jgi:hypothetical protein
MGSALGEKLILHQEFRRTRVILVRETLGL